MSDFLIRRTNSADPDFLALEAQLDAFLAVLNGEKDDFYSQLNKSRSLIDGVVAYSDGAPLGCGAFRQVESGEVEIKRMYVDPASRGKGIGAAILAELESWAAEQGHSQAILETSRRLTSAVGLYQKSGYEFIPNYGAYVDVEDSVCMRKSL